MYKIFDVTFEVSPYEMRLDYKNVLLMTSNKNAVNNYLFRMSYLNLPSLKQHNKDFPRRFQLLEISGRGEGKGEKVLLLSASGFSYLKSRIESCRWSFCPLTSFPNGFQHFLPSDRANNCPPPNSSTPRKSRGYNLNSNSTLFDGSWNTSEASIKFPLSQ